jgi:cobalt-zinc-cadmium efflux system outer membrane protein
MKTRMTTTGVVVAAMMWMSVDSAAAQDRPIAANEPSAAHYVDPATGISIEQAVAMGLEREPDLQAVRARVDAARGMRQQAGLRPNPTISAMRQEQIRGTDATTSTEIEWPLDLFRRTGRIAIAEREVEVAQLSVADRRRLLAADIRTTYGELVAAVRDLGISGELVVANRRGSELLRARVDQGASPPLERNIAEVEVRRMESQQLLQAARADAALIELKRLLGLGPRADVKVRDTLDALVEGPSPTAVPADLAPLVSERSDVREAEARLRLADARIDAARREGRFDVDLVGGFMRMGFSFPQLGFGRLGELEPIEDVFHSFTFGAMVMVPVGNRNQGAVAAALAERTGAEHLREARAVAAQSEVASAVARDDRVRQALAMYSSGVRTLARQNLEVVRETYELGRVTLSDVLAEQRRYLDIEMGYTEALRMAFEARTALARALGEIR